MVKKKKGNKYIHNLRTLITKSALKNKFNLLSPVLVIIISVIMTFIVLYILRYVVRLNLITSIVLSSLGYYLPQLILELIADINSSKVDKTLIDFMNLLCNFCKVKDDIVYAIDNASNFIGEPLKTFCQDFLVEVKGVAPIYAIQSFSNKIDNDQFRDLCKQLELCNKNSGKYLLALTKSKELYLKYYQENLNRKKEAKKDRRTLLGMVGILAITFILLNGVNPRLISELNSTFIGQAIVLYIAIFCVATFFVGINISKFKF